MAQAKKLDAPLRSRAPRPLRVQRVWVIATNPEDWHSSTNHPGPLRYVTQRAMDPKNPIQLDKGITFDIEVFARIEGLEAPIVSRARSRLTRRETWIRCWI
jgi:hypothetical protein